MWQITIIAKASNTVISIPVKAEELNMSVLEFLRSHSIPIASSCDGEGICKKCKINGLILSCEITVDEIIKNSLKVEVDYL